MFEKLHCIMEIVMSLILVFAHLILCPYIPKTYGFTMEMIPINSPNLQTLSQSFTSQETHELLANLSKSQAYGTQSTNTTLNPNTITLQPTTALRSFYIVPLSIGTIPGLGLSGGYGSYKGYAVLDTGESELWIQCEGCRPCFDFEGKKFDYRESITYERMAVHDNLCYPSIDYRGSCGFTKSYGYGGETGGAKGMVGRDTFYIPDKEGQIEVYHLAFGCAFENSDFKSSFVGPQNRISGILGLRPGRRSFLTQLDAQTRGRFSYCLALTLQPGVQRSTTLYFGDDAQIRGDATRRVKKITMSSEYGYQLSLVGISVDGNRLPINPSIFQPSPRASGARTGFIIDSGTSVTTLATSAYVHLHNAVAEYFEDEYGWQPIPHDPTKSAYKLCYVQYPTGQQRYPSVIFHFKRDGRQGEVKMEFAPFHMFAILPVAGNDRLCLMVLEKPDPGPCMFGATQQKNFRFLFDIPNSLLHFVPERCE